MNAYLYTIHATRLDHNGVRIASTNEETLGDLYRRLYGSEAEAQAAIDAADLDADVECTPVETILPRTVAWANDRDGFTYYGIDESDVRECVDDGDVSDRGTEELAEEFGQIKHVVLVSGNGGPGLTKALRTWRTA